METKFIFKFPGYLLALIRALLCIISMAIYLIIYLITLPFVKHEVEYANWWKKFWCRTACLILGIRLKVTFEAKELPETYLTVSNHVSFMDPVMALAVVKGMPVAKAEISKYPIIGYAANKTGIIWVEREKVKSRSAAKAAIEEALSKKKSVLVYPEGTISFSPTSLRTFKKGVFHAASQAEAKIVNCAIFYVSTKAYWKSENSMLFQFFEHFSTWKHDVYLHFSKPYTISNAEEGSKMAQIWIQKELNTILDAAKVN